MINPCLLCKTASDGNCLLKCQQEKRFRDFVPDLESVFDKDVPDTGIVGMRDLEHLNIWGEIAVLLYIIQRALRGRRDA